MKIDLSDKVQCFLVQEYVNKICNYESEAELNWDVHKLIHTFQVVQMAKELIKNTTDKLPSKIQKQIINSAVLHDLGRCYEFKFGKHLKICDHGKIGESLILKHFPNLKVEAQTTKFHNQIPSEKDPKECYPVLDYVRDADMLANIQYNIEHFDVFMHHIVMKDSKKMSKGKIDNEIIRSIQEKRSPNIKNVKENSVLTMFLWQLCWYYNLRTDAAKKVATKGKLFTKYRNCVCQKLISLLKISIYEQKELTQKIKVLFPDAIFKS